jgi:hypothetical protein
MPNVDLKINLIGINHIIFSVGLFAIIIISPESIIHIIKASETAEERAHERIESGTIQNGFSPVRPEQCKQVTKQSEKIAINYHHKV